MAFEFFKVAGSYIAIVQVKIKGKKYTFHTGAQKTKAIIIEKTFKFVAQA